MLTNQTTTGPQEQTEQYADWQITTVERWVQARRSGRRFYPITTVRATHPDGRVIAYTIEGTRQDALQALHARLDADVEAVLPSPATDRPAN